MEKTIKVLRKRVDEDWELVEIPDTMEALQREVGGKVDTVELARDAALIRRRDAEFTDERFNLTCFGLQHFGTVLIVGIDKGFLVALPCPDMWITKGVKLNDRC